jgi:phosphatidylglycerophosphatase A
VSATGPAQSLDLLLTWVAQGFGIGRIRWAPGTFGTLPGLVWFAVLLLAGSLLLFVSLSLVAIVAAAWVSDRAERVLQRHDPPSVVIDEIVAMPLCFLPWLIMASNQGLYPGPAALLTPPWIWVVLGGFVGFRIFDILKPWPARQIQSLPGGIGVVADDVIAALWVAVISLPVLLVLPRFP